MARRTAAWLAWNLAASAFGGQAVAEPAQDPVGSGLANPVPSSTVASSSTAHDASELAPPRTSSAAAPSELFEIHVLGERLSSPRGAGGGRIPRDQLNAAPHALTAELLSSSPGMFVDHEDGEGVANDVLLRGFDLDHGGGIELHAGAIPLNVPTHIHGQGYADLNVVIPEVVRSLHVTQGVFDPRQGDFAIAGSVQFDLGVEERGLHVKGGYGSFRQRRALVIWAPERVTGDSFGAVAFRHTDGFGPKNRAASSANAIGQLEVDLGSRYRLTLTGIAYTAEATLAGVVRANDLDAGRLDLFDSYPSALAGGQSAFTAQTMLGVAVERFAEDGAQLRLSGWARLGRFRLRENFTGAIESSQASGLSGLGDLDETKNDETAFGAAALYRFPRVRPAENTSIGLESGLSLRTSSTDQEQNLLQPRELTAWDRRYQAAVSAGDLGLYVDVDLRLWRMLRLSGGLRADGLYLSTDARVVKRLEGEPAPIIPGKARSQLEATWGPRASLELAFDRWIHGMISYGEGFRSSSGRQLVERPEQSGAAKSRTAEAGLRVELDQQRVELKSAFFLTLLSDELTFDAEKGGLESAGPSTRRGVVASIVARPFRWLVGTAAATYVRATYDAGGPVIGVPPLLLRLDCAVRQPLAELASGTLVGRAGLGLTYLAGRAISSDESGAAVTVVNAALGARSGPVEIGVDAYNLLDRRYPDRESRFASNWTTDAQLPMRATSERHVSAAPPRTLIGWIMLHL